MTRRRSRDGVHKLGPRELAALKSDVKRRSSRRMPQRWNADPEEVQRSVARLVLSLVEFLRRLLERQALRRMEAGTLTKREVEAVGLSLMRLEQTITDIAAHFRLSPDDLNLELGPLGRLM